MAEKEYIEREAFRREIDEHRPGRSYEDAWALTILDSIPAADVQPVVLCKDCKHGQGAKMDFWNEYEGIECIGGVVHRKDWFCAYGEKREES